MAKNKNRKTFIYAVQAGGRTARVHRIMQKGKDAHVLVWVGLAATRSKNYHDDVVDFLRSRRHVGQDDVHGESFRVDPV